jgi:DNA repair exonuclease SbcCD ATPase subunit
MRYVLLLLILSFSVPASAEIYKWVDDKGVINFTDNRDAIPAKYRKKALQISSEKPKPSAVEQGGDGQSAEPAQATEAQKSGTLYGGHDEDWWRERYASLRGEIKELQDNLPKKRQELEQLNRKYRLYTYSRNRVAYQEKADEIKSDEDRIRELMEKLNDLENEAGRAGIPFEWRK